MTANNDNHKAWAATVFSHLQRRELHRNIFIKLHVIIGWFYFVTTVQQDNDAKQYWQ